MDLLRAFHDYSFNTPLAKLFPNPFALVSFILMLWSVGPALKGVVGSGFTVFVRVCWAVFLLSGVSGMLLALSGAKVASAVAAAGQTVTRYGFAPDPKRNAEHWMYTSFALLSLFLIEALIAGKFLDRRQGLRVLPVVTLFMWGAAYMIGRVAIFPGNS